MHSITNSVLTFTSVVH
ncbi:BgTH12-05685 [Blumeria graminis f. sp. triticale]|uniref:BgTH12-05685 n=1 Tax=Blumeria graminis f. sp. triticale TaxID=1689686 RepID=A0A9W4D8M9_BLUGR|nr:BgTH12-05685 [Blumeria graminis f. sp. triticale]